MARTDYVVVNKLHKEATAASKINRLIGMVLVIFALAFFFLFNGTVLPPLSAGGAAIFFFSRSVPDAAVAAGAAGEDHAMSVLSRLPDSYVLFNQLDIPNAKSSTGVNEADVVVCGPNAIFVVEVKNNNGTISCDEGAPQWRVSKVGRNGGKYEKEMRNPIAQTKQLVWLLSEYLKRTNSKPWIQGVVVFTNPAAVLELNGPTSVPVLRPSELHDYLLSFKANSRPEVIARAKAELIGLRTRRTGAEV